MVLLFLSTGSSVCLNKPGCVRHVCTIHGDEHFGTEINERLSRTYEISSVRQFLQCLHQVEHRHLEFGIGPPHRISISFRTPEPRRAFRIQDGRTLPREFKASSACLICTYSTKEKRTHFLNLPIKPKYMVEQSHGYHACVRFYYIHHLSPPCEFRPE